MPKLTVPEFLADRNLVALKISSADLTGLFRKKMTVPKDCAGLALFADGAVSLLPEGREVSGKFELVLAKMGDVQIRVPLTDLRSADGFPIQSVVGIAVAIQTDRADLFKDFTRAFFNSPGSYSAEDLRRALLPEVKKILSEFAACTKAAELHKRDRFKEIDALLRPGLERSLFGTGVRLERVFEAQFAAPEFAQRAAADAKKRADDRRIVEKTERKEEQLRRLAGFLNDASVRDVLAKLPDERLKGLFYAKLMEDPVSLSPQDVAAKLHECGDNAAELVYKAMEGLLSGPASHFDPADFAPENAESIFVTLGSKVLAIDPSKPGDRAREFELKEPLRSVRCVETPDGPTLLVGAKRVVRAVSLKDGRVAEYPLPGDKQPRGGVNAVAAHGDSIFATHSEFGVVRWDRRKPSQSGELLWQDLTSNHRTTRGANVVGDRLLFASGDRLWSVQLGNGNVKPVGYISGLDGPVTALAASRNAIFAGTEAGTIVSWKVGDTNASVLVRRKEPIVNLRLAKVCSIPHLFYSTKDVSVRARVIGQNLETSYESDGASIGVLDAASDLVAASDAAGRRVLLWKISSPGRPAFDVDVGCYSDKPILDISMRKTRVRSD